MSKCRLVSFGSLLLLAMVLISFALYRQGLEREKHGVTCTISFPKREFKQGDEILVTFEIENRGKSPFAYTYRWVGQRRCWEPFPYMDRWFVRSGRWDEYKLVARREDGSVVVDPRATWGGFGGGPGLQRTLDLGESISKTISLNEWALISQPGRYTVVGSFTNNVYADREEQILIHSKPARIVIKRRTYEEMGRYINKLAKRLHEAKDSEEKRSIINKLIYTRDNRIVPALIDCEYAENGEYSAYEGFMYYLPLGKETKNMILRASIERGLVDTTLDALERFGCTEEELREVIAVSLGSDNPRCVLAGARAAQKHPHDSHVPRLIELAKDTDSTGRREAIDALARNRTDGSLRVLKELLEDPNERVRSETGAAIRRAYRIFQAHQKLDKVRIYSQFGSTGEVIAAARSRGSTRRWIAISELASRLDKDEIAAVSALLEDPDEDMRVLKTDERLRTIRDLLKDPDKDVVDVTTAFVRLTRRSCLGRPLRKDDFPEIYGEVSEAYRKAVPESSTGR